MNMLRATLIVLGLLVLVSSAQAKYSGGSGTAEDPYQIATAADMNAIGTDSNDWDKHFKLTADIDLSAYTGEEFNLIGYYSVSGANEPFTGVFDGNGHTISNFTYSTAAGDIEYIGLFGYCENAEIRDLGLVDPNVYVNPSTYRYVGTLIGKLGGGTISNCYVEGGSVVIYHADSIAAGLIGWVNEDSYISSCHTSCTVRSPDYSAAGGGLVGYVRGNTYYGAPPVISNCYSSSTVSAVSAGGLVHINCGAIVTECHATRAISVGTVTGAGGLVCVNQTMAPWYTEGVIANCYATGNVSGHDRVGGLIGYMENGTISDCYVQGASICGDSLCIGGLVGVVDAGTISGCYTTSSCSVSGWGGVGGLAGEVNSGATVTNCHSESSVSGAAFYGYDDDCISLGGLIGSNSGTVSNCHATGVVSGIVGAGVGDYFGGLIGNNGGTVSACYATGNISEGRSTMGGLVGYNAAGVTSYGTISDCYATGNVTGIRYLGGLAGDNRGTITNSRAEGNVTSTSTGVTDWSVGGFVGRNQSIIDQSYAIGTVSGYNRVGGLAGTNTTGEFTGGGVIGDITDCYATGSVSGNDKVGGLVGYNYTDASVANCFSAGSVSGISNTGGLVGERYFNSGAIANSFWDKQTSGQTTSDGGTGKTTAEMQTQTTFTSAGWDFLGETPNGTEDIWRLCVDLTDYPRFVWEKRLLGDFLCPDGSDFKDYAVLAGQWQQAPGEPSADIAPYGGNGIVDGLDLRVLCDNWLAAME